MSESVQCVKCAKCDKTAIDSMKGWYYVGIVGGGECDASFCSRRCLVEFIAPELSKAIAVKQWMPTEEEIERMRQ